jgi:hypothetical protein
MWDRETYTLHFANNIVTEGFCREGMFSAWKLWPGSEAVEFQISEILSNGIGYRE